MASTQKKVNGEDIWIEERERMECWQIEVYWEFDSEIIYSKGQSGAKQDWFSELYLTRATALTEIMYLWQI